MHGRRISATWLSDDMASALAAMCPPLRPSDVLRAADRLSEYEASPQMVVVDGMFRPDVDPLHVRRVIAALHALHDLRGRHAT